MKNLYNEDYYERGVEAGISGYSNYRWIPELTIPMCARFVEELLITDHQTILDFGCAKGYVVKGFRLLHKQAWGYDISEYALEHCDPMVKEYVGSQFPDRPYDWVIAKDVLEHIPKEELPAVLHNLSCISRNIFVAIPLGTESGYVVPSYNNDITHKTCESLEWWVNQISGAQFNVIQAGYTFPYLKENYSKWKNGNGFIRAKGRVS